MNHTSYEPKGSKIVHEQLCVEFAVWVMNGGYLAYKHGGMVEYKKPNKPTITISFDGSLNDAGQERYSLFLKQVFKHGKEFTAELSKRADELLKKKYELKVA